MNEEFSKVLSELVGSPVDMNFRQSFEKGGIDDSIILAIMQNKRLDRIADALEDISSRLAEACDRLQGIEETLGSCVCHNGRSHFLCITGNVSTN